MNKPMAKIAIHDIFRTSIAYDGPLPGKTAVSTPQIVKGLHNSYIRAANEKISKPQVQSFFENVMQEKLSLNDPNDKVVINLARNFLHDAHPPHRLKASWIAIKPEAITLSPETPMTLNERLLALLSQPDIRSRDLQVTRQQGTSIADNGRSVDANFDPYNIAWLIITEAVATLVATGADPNQIAIVADFSWAKLNVAARLGALVRCVQGCFDTAVSLKTPFIASKGSASPSDKLHISAAGIVPDGGKKIPLALQQAGNFIFVVGDSRAELGSSYFNQVGGRAEGSRTVPKPVPESLQRMQMLHKAMQAGLVQACRTCGAGGIAVALAEMCLAGGMGLELQLIHVPRDWHAAYSDDPVILFAESLSRFLVEVRPEDAGRLREMMADVPHECVAVVGGERVVVNGRIGQPILNLTLVEMAKSGHSTHS
ncbi:MAG: hypothetical protein GY805_34300 [Chloroflexi bacterium]|nr:hypothetical protein [Chloroflexota bacterium]